MKNKLELVLVSKSFGEETAKRELFSYLSLVFNQGTAYGITGVSGTGKSTLLAMMAGLERPSSGVIKFNDQPVESLATATSRFFFHNAISLLFQQAYILRELSVLENIMIKGLIAGTDYKTCIRRAQELIERVGLTGKEKTAPAQLSGGEQQRVALARALFCKPAFLLADEPTAHLDITHRTMIMELLKEYQKEFDMGLIMSTHDPSLTDYLDIVYKIDQGKLLKTV